MRTTLTLTPVGSAHLQRACTYLPRHRNITVHVVISKQQRDASSIQRQNSVHTSKPFVFKAAAKFTYHTHPYNQCA